MRGKAVWGELTCVRALRASGERADSEGQGGGES